LPDVVFGGTNRLGKRRETMYAQSGTSLANQIAKTTFINEHNITEKKMVKTIHNLRTINKIQRADKTRVEEQ
jgi:hypothetical protein